MKNTDVPASITEGLVPRQIAVDYSDGGHEIDVPAKKALIRFLSGLVIVIILASIMVYQILSVRTDASHAAGFSTETAFLKAQREHDHKMLTSWGIQEIDGQKVYRMPVAEAKERILKNPSLFAPAPAPAGFKHPDD